MKFRIVYYKDVVDEDIPRLSYVVQKRIKKAIEEKLAVSPEVFGKPLRKSLAGYRKLRVGDYCIVFRIPGEEVRIVLIDHRSVVYRNADKRTEI